MADFKFQERSKAQGFSVKYSKTSVKLTASKYTKKCLNFTDFWAKKSRFRIRPDQKSWSVDGLIKTCLDPVFALLVVEKGFEHAGARLINVAAALALIEDDFALRLYQVNVRCKQLPVQQKNGAGGDVV